MSDEYEPVSVSRGVRALRWVIPWVAFALLVWVIAGIFGDFVRVQGSVSAGLPGSTGASSTAGSALGSVMTTVTGLTAMLRTDVPLMSQPGTGTAVVATPKEGSALEILARQGTWLRVKDAAGHIGWIPNSTRFIAVKATTAKPKK